MSGQEAIKHWRPEPNHVARVCWMLAATLAAAYVILFMIEGTGADAITQIWMVTVVAAGVIIKLGYPDQFGRAFPTALVFITVPIFAVGMFVNGWTESNPAPQHYWGIVVMHFIVMIMADFLSEGGSWNR